MGGVEPWRHRWITRLCAGDPDGLVYDFPDSTASVPPDHVEGWPLEADAVWEIAIDNVRLEPQPTRQDVPAQGGVFTMTIDDSFYVATRALRLADELPPGTVDAVFAVPNRHMLLWHAIRDLSVVGAMQGDDAGHIEGIPRRSRLDQRPARTGGTRARSSTCRSAPRATSIAFIPPDEFVALLDTLAAP